MHDILAEQYYHAPLLSCLWDAEGEKFEKEIGLNSVCLKSSMNTGK